MKFKNLFIVTFIALIPVALFWGCGSSTQPISPSNLTTMTIQIPPVGAHSEFIPAAQNMILYNVSSGSASATGSYGPLTASGVTGQINFSIKLPANISTYSLISLEIVDNVTQTALAVGAASLSNNSSMSVTLGPLNKTSYQATLATGYGFGFESAGFPVSIGLNTPTTVAGVDVVSNPASDNSGYVLENPSFTGSTVAYMGNGNFVNFLRAPTNFSIASGVSKKAVLGGGTNPVAVGDVYCIKMKAGGYAWLQITNAGSIGLAIPPSFSFRVNTTLNYCGYEQTTADVAASGVSGTPTPYAPTKVFNGVGNDYGLAVYPSNSTATTLYVADATANTAPANIRIINVSTSSAITIGLFGNFPTGLAVNSAGTTLYEADPLLHVLKQYSLPGASLIGTVGSGVTAPIPDTAAAASVAEFQAPRCVALDPTGNLFVTDYGTNGFADVMVIDAPTNTSSAALTYWNGLIGTNNNTSGIATDGSKVYIADAGSNRIETYNTSGNSGTILATTDNNPAGAVAFSGPQGIALDAGDGLLFIADTGNNRVVELTTSGVFKAAWGPNVGTAPTISNPTAIAVDGAFPPNVFLADSGNNRVLQFKGL